MAGIGNVLNFLRTYPGEVEAFVTSRTEYRNCLKHLLFLKQTVKRLRCASSLATDTIGMLRIGNNCTYIKLFFRQILQTKYDKLTAETEQTWRFVTVSSDTST